MKIPHGWFTIGCSPSDAECHDEERITKRVYINDFYMDVCEVTQSEYQNVMGKTPSHFKHCSNCPVESVSWFNARDYCQKVNKRLPTEAEWEYAARGGTSGARYSDLESIAWYLENSGGKTHPVGRKQSNAYGLYDMLGNVWEWCQDWYDEKWYIRMPQRNPANTAESVSRTVRGGSWDFDSAYIRTSFRGNGQPDFGNDRIGFRCSRDAD